MASALVVRADPVDLHVCASWQSGGFLDVALLAGVALLLAAWPCRLLAFAARARFGVGQPDRGAWWSSGTASAWPGWSVAPASREVKVLTMSRLGIRALPGPGLRLALAPAAPLDTRHPGHHERDGDDDQAGEDRGLLPSGDPRAAGRRRRPIPGACSSPHTGSKKPAIYF
jgi:hypothetical protein